MTTKPDAPPGAPAPDAAPNSRRDFLMKAGLGAGVVALVGQAGASLRSLVPNVSYDAPTTVKLGAPTDFPDGMKFLPDQRLFVFRDGKTFHAISAVCTHLGCTVRAEALSRVEEKPVEEQVRLREERVRVERRPVDREVTNADAAAFKEGTIEVREMAEQAAYEEAQAQAAAAPASTAPDAGGQPPAAAEQGRVAPMGKEPG